VLECLACRKQWAPVDQHLGLEERQEISPRIRRKLARLGARMDYVAAAEDLQYLLGVKVSSKQAQLVTREAGEKALQLEQRQCEEWSRPWSAEHPVKEEKPHQALVLEMDGTCVLGRKGEGHEIKVATVFGLDERGKSASGREIISERRWAATSLGVEAFSPLVHALAVRWGMRGARSMAVVADGAEWIWKLVEDRFAHATCILDFWHASEHLHELAAKLWPKDEQKRLRWAGRWSERLRDGQVERLIRELLRLEKMSCAERAKALKSERGYFENNRKRCNYPEYVKAGWPIGSGAVEGSCKSLIKERMAGSGQHWSSDGMEEMAALRTALFNGDWDNLWQQDAA